MAKEKTSSLSSKSMKTKSKRKGIHSKCNSSKSKKSKNYFKKYSGQGR